MAYTWELAEEHGMRAEDLVDHTSICKRVSGLEGGLWWAGQRSIQRRV